MMITPSNVTDSPPGGTTTTPPRPFFFVSDDYTAGQIIFPIRTLCPNDFVISDRIPFNSTGNIQKRSVVQSYRGYTAVIVFQGYEDLKELPDNSPFPPGINVKTWTCLNNTIGDSIPLMSNPPQHHSHFSDVAILAIVFFLISLAVVFCINAKKIKRVYGGCRDLLSNHVPRFPLGILQNNRWKRICMH